MRRKVLLRSPGPNKCEREPAKSAKEDAKKKKDLHQYATGLDRVQAFSADCFALFAASRSHSSPELEMNQKKPRRFAPGRLIYLNCG
jgi:hypothetical protein